jgi:hypothetical protein
MNKWIVASGAFWTAAFASTALLIHQINRPLDSSTVVNAAVAPAPPAVTAEPVAGAPVPVLEEADPAVLELPMVTIVGHRPGVAEMQRVDDELVAPDPVTSAN